ncbi:protein sneaky-like [Asterias rubens]|uniref:protein sneaky-like n=1 Tax=Asterias rubens TaxID=7604 RepID=UPI001455106E|nr:protein sneaky-like [Asterias rubens]
MSCLVKCCDYCIPAVKGYLECICPWIYRIFFGTGRCECVAIRTVLGLAFGGLLGAGLYVSIVDKLNYPEQERQLFGGVLTLLLALGFACSVQVRCIVLLSVPTFFGRFGRSLITSYAIFLLVTGPMNNIMLNADESSRAISCTTDLTFNHSKEIFQLLYKPFHDAFIDAGIQQDAIDDDAETMKSEFRQYVEEIEGDRFEKLQKFDEEEKTSDSVEQGFNLKSLRRCKDVFVEGLADCEPAYHRVWAKCKKRYPVWHLIVCLPLHAFTVCSLLRLLEGFCPSLPNQPKKTIEMFMRVKNGFQSLTKNFKVKLKWKVRRMHVVDFCLLVVVKCMLLPLLLLLLCQLLYCCETVDLIIDYKVKKLMKNDCDNLYSIQYWCSLIKDSLKQEPKNQTCIIADLNQSCIKHKPLFLQQPIHFPVDLLNSTAIEAVVRKMNHEIHLKKQWLDALVFIVEVLLSFAFVLVFISASGYNTKYLKDIDFDNVYMTAYFRRIDARRKKQNKRTLLPLKKAQKSDIIETVRWKLRKEEKKSSLMGFMRLTMRLVVTVAMVFFDHLFFLMLDLIARNSQLDYKFKGEHRLEVKVEGTGIVAQMFKKVLSSFSHQHSISTIATNKQCLPVPSAPNNKMTMMVFAAWGAVWLSLYFEAYALRLRRIICAYFYPKKEKQRIVFLYNEQLKKKSGFLKHLRYTVRQLAKEKRLGAKIGTLTTLYIHWPRLCGWLGIFGLGKRSCLICDEKENKDFHKCSTEGCDFAYCCDCWRDIKKVCYACKISKDTYDGEVEFLSESE